MDQEYVLKSEYSIQVKRFEDETNRQNHRLTKLEDEVKITKDLTVAIEKMAVNMGYMKDEIRVMREEIEALKNIPASRWDKLISGIIGAVDGIIGAALIAAILHYT